MNTSKKTRKTAVLTLVLATVLFTAGAGQAMALDHDRDGDFGSNVVIQLLERIGDFVGDVAGEVIDIVTKAGATPAQDG